MDNDLIKNIKIKIKNNENKIEEIDNEIEQIDNEMVHIINPNSKIFEVTLGLYCILLIGFLIL